jgi:hypothetical protein
MEVPISDYAMVTLNWTSRGVVTHRASIVGDTVIVEPTEVKTNAPGEAARYMPWVDVVIKGGGNADDPDTINLCLDRDSALARSLIEEANHKPERN